MQVDSEWFQQRLAGLGNERAQWRSISIHIPSEPVTQRWGPSQEDYVQCEVVDWRGDKKCLLSDN